MSGPWKEDSTHEIGNLIAVPDTPDAPKRARQVLEAMRSINLYRGMAVLTEYEVRPATDEDIAIAQLFTYVAKLHKREGAWYAKAFKIEKPLFAVVAIPAEAEGPQAEAL